MALVEQFINGNRDTVRAALRALDPAFAAAMAAQMVVWTFHSMGQEHAEQLANFLVVSAQEG